MFSGSSCSFSGSYAASRPARPSLSNGPTITQLPTYPSRAIRARAPSRSPLRRRAYASSRDAYARTGGVAVGSAATSRSVSSTSLGSPRSHSDHTRRMRQIGERGRAPSSPRRGARRGERACSVASPRASTGPATTHSRTRATILPSATARSGIRLETGGGRSKRGETVVRRDACRQARRDAVPRARCRRSW